GDRHHGRGARGGRRARAAAGADAPAQRADQADEVDGLRPRLPVPAQLRGQLRARAVPARRAARHALLPAVEERLRGRAVGAAGEDPPGAQARPRGGRVTSALLCLALAFGPFGSPSAPVTREARFEKPRAETVRG